MKKLPKIEITELFLAKKNWQTTFIGTVTRDIYDDGTTCAHGMIPVNDGIIYAEGKSDDELSEKLDSLVILVLDYKIHSFKGKIDNLKKKDDDSKGIDFYLN